MRKDWIRRGAAVVLVLLMAGVSELLGEREIIFPEIMALAIGMWAAERQPWRVKPVQMIPLLTLSAVMGVLLVRYVPLPLLLKIALGFLFTAGLLTLTNTTFYPVISACILPVLLGTQSWVYPVSVFLMAVLLVSIQQLMVRLGLREKEAEKKAPAFQSKELLKWGGMLLAFLVLAAVPVHFEAYAFIAPPLIVTFVEFSDPESGKRRTPVRIFITIAFCAVIGTACRLLHETVNVPLTVCAGFAALLVFAVFSLVKTPFPPAGAIVLLPMILEADGLWLYPIQASVGAAVLMLCAVLLFRQKKVSSVLEEAAGDVDE